MKNKSSHFNRVVYLAIPLLFSTIYSVHAQTCTALANGNWTTASNWSCGHVPVDGETVVIPDGITVTVNSPLYGTNPRPFLTISVGNDDGDGSGGTLSVTGPGKLDLLQGSQFHVTPNSVTGGSGGAAKVRWYTADGTEIADLTGDEFDKTGPVTVWNGSDVPLPVELTFLKSTPSNGRIIIQWQTASELNNDYFDVERSEDGSTFYAIGRVTGNGTTDLVQNYQFTDKSPIATVEYYRLKQVDFDGAFEYSKVIVGYSDDIASQVRMTTYPNPAVERVSIKSTSPLTFAKLHLINLAGQVVADLSDKVTGYGIAYDVELPALDKGLYYLLYQTSTGQAGAHKLLIK